MATTPQVPDIQQQIPTIQQELAAVEQVAAISAAPFIKNPASQAKEQAVVSEVNLGIAALPLLASLFSSLSALISHAHKSAVTKTTMLLIAFALAFTIPSFAQSTSTFFVGGSYTHNGDLPKSIKGVPGFLKSGTDIGGVDVGLSSKLFGPLGLAFDGNFSHSTQQNQFLFAGGPELSKRFTNQRLFVHALIGGAYETQKLKGFALTSLADSSFAYVLGGGYEKFFSKRVGVRTGLDYFYTEAFHSNDHNIRASLGLVIR